MTRPLPSESSALSPFTHEQELRIAEITRETLAQIAEEANRRFRDSRVRKRR